MLQALASLFTHRSRVEEDPAAAIGDRPPELSFPPMTALDPPPAVNDDVLASLRHEVERELRSAGFLT